MSLRFRDALGDLGSQILQYLGLDRFRVAIPEHRVNPSPGPGPVVALLLLLGPHDAFGLALLGADFKHPLVTVADAARRVGLFTGWRGAAADLVPIVVECDRAGPVGRCKVASEVCKLEAQRPHGFRRTPPPAPADEHQVADLVRPHARPRRVAEAVPPPLYGHPMARYHPQRAAVDCERSAMYRSRQDRTCRSWDQAAEIGGRRGPLSLPRTAPR